MRKLLLASTAAFALAGCTADIYHTNGAAPHPDRDLGLAFRLFVVDRGTKKEDALEFYAGMDLPDFIVEK